MSAPVPTWVPQETAGGELDERAQIVADLDAVCSDLQTATPQDIEWLRDLEARLHSRLTNSAA